MKFITILRLFFLGISFLPTAYAMEKREQAKASSGGTTQQPSAGQIALEVGDRFYFHSEGPQPQAITFYTKAATQTVDLVSAFCAADMLRAIMFMEKNFDACSIWRKKAAFLFDKVDEKQIKNLLNNRLVNFFKPSIDLLKEKQNNSFKSELKRFIDNVLTFLICSFYQNNKIQEDIISWLPLGSSFHFVQLLHENSIAVQEKCNNCSQFVEYQMEKCENTLSQFTKIFHLYIKQLASSLQKLREEVLWEVGCANYYKKIPNPKIEAVLYSLQAFIYSCQERESTITNPLWVQARYMLGKYNYLIGKNGEKSLQERRYLESHANFDNVIKSNMYPFCASAYVALGQLYQRGKIGKDHKPDYTQAFNCYTAAIQDEQEKKGLEINQKARIKAWHGLGYLHYFGKEDEPFKADVSKAKDYFELVSQQDDIPRLRADAFRRLGDIYFYGKGVIRSYKKTLSYYSRALPYYSKALDDADKERELYIRKQLARLESYNKNKDNTTEDTSSIIRGQIDE